MGYYIEVAKSLIEDSIPINEVTITNNNNKLNMKNNKSMPCTITVYDREGPVPHFHFMFVKNNKYIEGCIMIEQSNYFIHGGHKGVLNNDETKILNEWMTSSNDVDSSINNWYYICNIWNRYNTKKVPSDIQQPDYSMLNY